MTAPILRDIFGVFLKIGLLSFGGPAAQIALMHRMLVEERSWLDEKQFLNALSFCMLLPGPEAMQLATYAGWRLRGVAGGLIAGTLFVLPGAAVIFVLATLYVWFGDVPMVSALFLGVKAAVLIIVLEALLKISRKALHGAQSWALSAIAFLCIFFLALPFPVIVFAAAIYGAVFLRDAQSDQPAPLPRGAFTNTAKTVVVGVAAWVLPLFLASMVMGGGFIADLSLFFSKLAVVTFGGAYAVLAYMGQEVVTEFGWLTTAQMMDGLGLAEATPGPLILVTEFVGFLAGYSQGGFGLATLAVIITLWATFVPCFLWIFAGAPYVEWITAQPRLRGALNAITAAVVGVILNLSVWFGLHVLFGSVTQTQSGPFTLWLPEWATLDWRAVALAIVAGFLLLRLKLGIVWVLAICAVAAFAISNLGIG